MLELRVKPSMLGRKIEAQKAVFIPASVSNMTFFDDSRRNKEITLFVQRRQRGPELYFVGHFDLWCFCSFNRHYSWTQVTSPKPHFLSHLDVRHFSSVYLHQSSNLGDVPKTIYTSLIILVLG